MPDNALMAARAGYGGVEVLHGIDLVFPAGSVVALVGRNGAGKSSVLKCLAGILPLRSGTFLWCGSDATRLTPYQRSVAGMTLVPDRHAIFDDLTVEENLSLFAGAQDRPDAALQVFPELTSRLGQQAGTLSGGEQQMLALSRAFLHPGKALLVDEVSRGLSRAVTVRCYEALSELVTPERAIIIVEQYVEDVLKFADLVFVLTRGEVSFAGEPQEYALTLGR